MKRPRSPRERSGRKKKKKRHKTKRTQLPKRFANFVAHEIDDKRRRVLGTWRGQRDAVWVEARDLEARGCSLVERVLELRLFVEPKEEVKCLVKWRFFEELSWEPYCNIQRVAPDLVALHLVPGCGKDLLIRCSKGAASVLGCDIVALKSFEPNLVFEIVYSDDEWPPDEEEQAEDVAIPEQAVVNMESHNNNNSNMNTGEPLMDPGFFEELLLLGPPPLNVM